MENKRQALNYCTDLVAEFIAVNPDAEYKYAVMHKEGQIIGMNVIECIEKQDGALFPLAMGTTAQEMAGTRGEHVNHALIVSFKACIEYPELADEVIRITADTNNSPTLEFVQRMTNASMGQMEDPNKDEADTVIPSDYLIHITNRIDESRFALMVKGGESISDNSLVLLFTSLTKLLDGSVELISEGKVPFAECLILNQKEYELILEVEQFADALNIINSIFDEAIEGVN